MSLRGGFEQQAHCQLFHFTGQLDAYSDKQFGEFLDAHRTPPDHFSGLFSAGPWSSMVLVPALVPRAALSSARILPIID